jgi:hypothetical protein
MKYKKKSTKVKNNYAERGCISVKDYAIYTSRKANADALLSAKSLIPASPYVFNNCAWTLTPQVRNARFELRSGAFSANIGGYGLQPSPRCSDDAKALSKARGLSRNCGEPQGTDINEYTPGGQVPPCPGGAEGTCAPIDFYSTFSKGSFWGPLLKPEKMGVDLIFEYNSVASNPVPYNSGRPCGSPPTFTWGRKVLMGGFVEHGSSRRCVDNTNLFDCCCSCPPDQVKIPQVIPGLAPCSNLAINQAQVEQLRSAIEAAMIAGACILAVALAAKLTALLLPVLIPAGCAYTMITLTTPCQNEQ